jgi:hypothetical protein
MLHIKDPSAITDWTLDWSAWLNSAATSDTIASVTWTVPTGLTQTAQSHTTTTATVWLSGGTLKHTYRVPCQITSAGGRTEVFSLEILVQQK